MPALLALANPFSHMNKLADEFISGFPKAKEMKLYLPEEVLERNKMIKHQFRTGDRLAELSPDTHIFIATSGRDAMIHPSHSRRLARIARQHGLTVKEKPYPECGHLNLPMADLAQSIIRAYEESKAAALTPEARVKRMVNMRDGVYRPQRYVTLETLRDQQPDASQPQLTR